MDEDQIALVQASFEAIRPDADTVVALFYERLFTLDPSARALFQGDMHNQKQKFLDMLTAMLENLSHLDTITPEIQEMGRRHAHYGVQSRHYVTVGVALLWALRHSLGAHFTAETEAAWARAYALLADLMESAAVRERLGDVAG